MGKYTIEIEGNTEYLPTTKVVNLINEEDEEIVTVFIGVKPRIEADFEFSFLKEDYSPIETSKI